MNLVTKVYKKLDLQSISLLKEKLIRGCDEKLAKKIIIHKILSTLIINNYKKSLILMLITDIKHCKIILKKS